MAGKLLALSVALAFFGAVGFSIHLLTVTWPIYSHRLFIDYPDPARPGQLKGVLVSPAEFWRETLTDAAFWALALTLGVAKLKISRRERLSTHPTANSGLD